MDQPPRRIFLKITALTFALGAGGCYVWQAQVKQAIRHVSGTKRSNSIVDAETKEWISSTKRPNYIFKDHAKQRISGTKSITQPVFNTRELTTQKLLFGKDAPPSVPEPSLVPQKQPLDYPGYPPQPKMDWADQVDSGGDNFTSTKSGVPLIKVKPAKP